MLYSKQLIFEIWGNEVSMYHEDSDVKKAMTTLADALCTWERNTGRRSLLILVPRQPDENVVMLFDGKPANETAPSDLLLALADAYVRRPGSTYTNPIILQAAADCVGAVPANA